MGIRGLQSFMNACKDVTERVMLSEKVELYRSETGKDPVLVIDISSVARCFFTGSPMCPYGGLKKYKEDFETFINNCSHLGVKVKVFGDGKKPEHKFNVWRNKIVMNFKELKKIYFERKIPDSYQFYAGFIFYVIHNVLLDNCEYSRAVWEADEDIIEYLKPEGCFAVLTNDTDFLMLNNVQYCLSPVGVDLRSMTFLNYNRSKLAEVLGINASQLPLFASFCKNYSFKNFDLEKFYERLEIDQHNQFPKVAEFVKNFDSKEELLQNVSSLMNEDDMQCLKKRVNFYFGCENKKDVVHFKDTWGEILLLALERHKTGVAHYKILQIITDFLHFLVIACECVSNPLPANSLLPLRKKIYGIIFFECPKSRVYVTEFLPECSEGGAAIMPKQKTVMFHRRFHPGLLKLWSPSCTVQEKGKVFCQAINEKLSFEFLCKLNITEEYLFPVLAAFYFLWELDKMAKDFEVKTILIQAVLTNNLTSEQIEYYPTEFHVGALDLIGWFFQILEVLQLLSSACGGPFCEYRTNMVNFFDGKILQYVYSRMMEGTNPLTFLNPDIYETYEILYSKLMELGRKCGHVTDAQN